MRPRRQSNRRINLIVQIGLIVFGIWLGSWSIWAVLIYAALGTALAIVIFLIQRRRYRTRNR